MQQMGIIDRKDEALQVSHVYLFFRYLHVCISNVNCLLKTPWHRSPVQSSIVIPTCATTLRQRVSKTTNELKEIQKRAALSNKKFQTFPSKQVVPLRGYVGMDGDNTWDTEDFESAICLQFAR